MVETRVRLGAAWGSSKLGRPLLRWEDALCHFAMTKGETWSTAGRAKLVGILGGRIRCGALVIWRYDKNAVGIRVSFMIVMSEVR